MPFSLQGGKKNAHYSGNFLAQSRLRQDFSSVAVRPQPLWPASTDGLLRKQELLLPAGGRH
jgi:hypothetical protein